MSKHKQITTIAKGRVRITRKGFDVLTAEANRVLGLEFYEVEPGKGPVTLSLDVWLFTLSVLQVALEYSGYIGETAGAAEACGPEGCDFSFGQIAVTLAGDVIVCGS